MIKPFAKLFQFDDIGQVLVMLDEAEDPDTSGPEIVISFKPDLLDRVADEDPEQYGMNEGYSRTLTFPDDLDLAACGIDLYEADE